MWSNERAEVQTSAIGSVGGRESMLLSRRPYWFLSLSELAANQLLGVVEVSGNNLEWVLEVNQILGEPSCPLDPVFGAGVIVHSYPAESELLYSACDHQSVAPQS